MPMWNPFARLTNRGRTAAPDPARAARPLPFLPSALYLNTEQALALSPIYASVQLISNAVACSDFQVCSVQDGILTAMPEVAEDDLLNWYPCPEMLASQVKAWIVRDMLVHGCGYAELVRDGGGRVTQIVPWYAERVAPLSFNGTLYYEYTDDDGKVSTFLPENVLVVPFGRLGESIVRQAMRAAGLAKAEQDFALTYFANGMSMGGAIEHPGKLTPKQREEFKDSLVTEHQGPGKNSGTLFLDGGAKYNQFEANASEAQLLESRKYSVVDLARFFGLHPAVLGDEQSANGYGANQVAFKIHSYQNGLLPVANTLAEALTIKLFPRRSRRQVSIDLSWWLDGGRQAQATADAQDVAAQILNPDEIRNRRGLPPMKSREKWFPKPTPAAAPEPMGPANPPPGEAKPPQEDPAKRGNQEKALVNTVTAALERHVRRTSARKTDLQKSGKSETEIVENVASLYSRGAEEVSYLLEIAQRPLEASALRTALDSVCAGVEPEKAARHLLGN